MANEEPDTQTITDLISILSSCPTGYCRSKDLHDRPGFYARAFARGEAIAYVGYSESLHYALQEIIENCLPRSGCLAPGEIAVRRLPKISESSNTGGVGWIDGLSIATNLSESKKKAALAFLNFATSEKAYQIVLKPNWMQAPRYLLPAKSGIDLSDGPLYQDLLAAHNGRMTGTTEGLNAKLQSLSTKVNCSLPIDRTDLKSTGACSRH